MRSEIYRQAVARAPTYTSLNPTKVMVACIDWTNTELPKLKILYSATTYTNPSSDKPFGYGELSQNSTNKCEQMKAARGLQCDCSDLLFDEDVVLRQPG